MFLMLLVLYAFVMTSYFYLLRQQLFCAMKMHSTNDSYCLPVDALKRQLMSVGVINQYNRRIN